jgi:hypothetical protein
MSVFEVQPLEGISLSDLLTAASEEARILVRNE